MKPQTKMIKSVLVISVLVLIAVTISIVAVKQSARVRNQEIKPDVHSCC